MCTSVSLEENKQCSLKAEFQSSPHLPAGDPLTRIPGSQGEICRGIESDKRMSNQNIFANSPSGIITPILFSLSVLSNCLIAKFKVYFFFQ